jgi:hypothetical protein
MKIALIRRKYITHLSSINKSIGVLAEGLAKLGHNVLFFS